MYVSTLLLGACWVLPSPAQLQLFGEQANWEALRKEIEILKQGQKDIQASLKAIQAKPKSKSPIEPIDITVTLNDHDYALGNADAKLTLIEFSDYQCPFCRRHFNQTVPKLLTDFVDTGKIRYVYRDFPLQFHKDAPKAAEAAICSGEQGKFWEMNKRLYENQKKLKPADLEGHAEAVGLDMAAFKACLESGRHADGVKKDMADASKGGITGTPSFYLGYTQPDGTVKAVRKIRGAQSFDKFEAVIGELLKAEKPN